MWMSAADLDTLSMSFPSSTRQSFTVSSRAIFTPSSMWHVLVRFSPRKFLISTLAPLPSMLMFTGKCAYTARICTGSPW